MPRPRLTYANVVSSIALFVALGGTGYAVTKLPRNSVGTTQLKANAVTSGKIRKGAVRASDLAASARGGSRGPRGPVGPAGPKGDSGASNETIQVRKPAAISIPTDAAGSVPIASVTLTAGNWLISARARVIYTGTGAADFFDCDLTTGGQLLQRGSLRLGEDAPATSAGTIPLQFATTFTTTTEVVFSCRHAGGVLPGNPIADQSDLLATRLGGLEDR